MLPEVMNFSPAQERYIDSHSGEFEDFGMSLESVGPGRYALRAIPECLGEPGAAALRNIGSAFIEIMMQYAPEGPEGVDIPLEPWQQLAVLARPITPLKPAKASELLSLLAEHGLLESAQGHLPEFARRLDGELLGQLF